jgi:hypothetical protein
MFKRLGRSIFVVSCVAIALFIAPMADARAPALSLGEVSVAPGAPLRYRQLIADTLSKELAGTRLGAKSNSYVINARLSRLSTEGVQPAKSSCTISLVLTEPRGGAIFAMAEGRVRVEDERAEHAEVTAIQAAARSAMKSVSSALR